MMPTTIDVIKAGLKSDPSLTPSDRARLLGLLRNGVAKSEDETSAERVARIIRRREAATRLSCSLRTIDKLHAQGILKKHRLPGRQRCSGFLESDVNALVLGRAA